MGKRKGKKLTSTLTWKAAKGLFRLVFQGILKATPALFFAAISFAIFWGIREDLYADPGFSIQSFEVVPPESLSPSKVAELQKLYLNRSLFKVSPEEVAAFVSREPKIRKVRVVRKFPRTLRIEIGERNPFVQIQVQPKGPYYVASEDGVVLSEDHTRNKNLLFVEVFEAKDLKPKSGESVDLPGFGQGIALAKAFWGHPLARTESIERIRLDHLGNVSVVLTQGPELRFGRYPLKKLNNLAALTPLLKGPDRDRIVYIELQYQDLIMKKK